MNLRQLAEVIAAAEAVTSAARTAFREEALRRFTEDQMAPGGKTPDGSLTFTSSFTHTTLQVEDRQTFLEWLAEHRPGAEQEMVTRLEVRVPAWLDAVRAEIAEAVQAGMLDAPPGTKLIEGGTYIGTSLTVDRQLKQNLGKMARWSMAVETDVMTALAGLVVSAAQLDEQ